MPASKSTSMIWNGQGPVHIGTYDPVKGRPEMVDFAGCQWMKIG